MISSNLISLLFLILFTTFAGLGYSLYFNKGNLFRAIITAPLASFILLSLVTAYFSYAGYNIEQFSKLLVPGYFIVGVILLLKNIPALQPLQKIDIELLVIALLFAIINACIVLSPVVLHNSWYFYNDHTTYITQSEYLQNHSFFDLANPTKEPWTDNMFFYQHNSMRMGAQFFTGLIKSTLNSKHTLEIYPSIAAFAEFLIILSVALFSVGINRNRWQLLIVLTMMTFAMMINHWVIMMGFLPQAFGIALIIAINATLIALTQNKLTRGQLIFNIVMFASLILTYQEIVPFAMLTICIVCILLMLNKIISIKEFVQLGFSFGLSLVLFPISSLFLIKGLLNQQGAVVGWNAKISLTDFILGFFGQDAYSHTTLSKKFFLFLPGIVSSLILCIICIRKVDIKKTSYQIIFCMLSVYVIAVFFFRFFVQNPFDLSIGHTWNIYKIVQWSYWLFIVAISIAVYDFTKTRNLAKGLLMFVFVMFVPSIYSNFKLLSYYNSYINVKHVLGGIKAPLEQYEDLIQDVRNNKYKPANIFFNDIHPYYAYLPMNILKDNSKGVFLKPNNTLMFVQDENNFLPSNSPNYYQWIYRNNERASDRDMVTSLAGFDIYPKQTSIAHFFSGFGQREVYGKDHLAWMIKKEGQIRLLIVGDENATLSIVLNAINEGVLTLNSKENILSTSVSFSNGALTQKLNIPNIKPGFYDIKVTWNGDVTETNSDARTLIVMFKNSTIYAK